jgi:hypothetical protein
MPLTLPGARAAVGLPPVKESMSLIAILHELAKRSDNVRRTDSAVTDVGHHEKAVAGLSAPPPDAVDHRLGPGHTARNGSNRAEGSTK